MSAPLMTRRVILASGAAAVLAACDNGLAMNGALRLDSQVDGTRDFMFRTYPTSQTLVQNAAGVLYMPLITEAGFGIGGAYGRGALRIQGATVDYYAATKGSVGFQVGAQQYAHVLIFQTPQALADFRNANGWVAGAGAYYALPEQGMAIGTDTMVEQYPVLAMIFGQTGLMAGASIAGTKYTRIVP